MKKLLPPCLALFAACSLQGAVVGKNPMYTVGYNTGGVYSVDIYTGAVSQILTIPGEHLCAIAPLNSNTAYTLDYTDGTIYKIDVLNLNYSQIASIGVNCDAIDLLNNQTAVVTGDVIPSTVYTVNLGTGEIQLKATLPSGVYAGGVAALNEQFVYVSDYHNQNIYGVNLDTGSSSLITPAPLDAVLLWQLALQDSNTIYTPGDGIHNLIKVDIQTGASTEVASGIGSSYLDGISLNSNWAYLVNSVGDVFSVNLTDGTFETIAHISAVDLWNNGILRQIETNALKGNNLTLASYLNAEADVSVIRSIALLPQGLDEALFSVSPLRNAFSTIAAGHNLLGCSQMVINHMHQSRMQNRGKEGIVAVNGLDVKEHLAGPIKQKKRSDPFNVWVSPFGEYARLKGRGAVPTACIGTGGIVAGFDTHWNDANCIGVAIAYAFAHVHENQDAGKADLNQGAINLYGEIKAGNWYIDLSAFGGYYVSCNERHIFFPGIDETAKATIHGWQLAPHFEVGYDGFLSQNAGSGWRGVEPFLLADWVGNGEHSFQEKGAGLYNMGQEGRFCSLLRSEVGMRLEQAVLFDSGKLGFTEKASYTYQKGFGEGRITAFLVGSPSSFTVEAFKGAQSLGVAEVSLIFLPKAKHIPNFELSYQAEFGSRYQLHQGVLDICKSF